MNENIYFGASINDSATIAVTAAEDLSKARGKAVKISDGKAKLCDQAGEAPFGIAIYQGRKDIKKDEDFSVQIKDIGIALAGGAVAVGDFVSTDAEGYLVKCESGFALGVAVTAAESKDEPFYVQITKSGVIAGGSGSSSSTVNFDLSKATGTLGIDKGGTGATSASEALDALLESQPLPVKNGGTGAASASEALDALLESQPLPITKGGTGASDKDTAVSNLGAQKAE